MTTTVRARCFEFCFPEFDTLVQVEETDGEVVIRATRNTFSARRQECFIHELAAEGFIDDGYRWFSSADANPSHRIRWLVDHSWLEISPELTASTRRFMLRLLGATALLWLVLMTTLFVRAAG